VILLHGSETFARIFGLRGRLTRHVARDADDDNNKIIKPGDGRWRGGRVGGRRVQLFINLALEHLTSPFRGETLAMARRPRGERFYCRGGSRALLNVWHGPKGN